MKTAIVWCVGILMGSFALAAETTTDEEAVDVKVPSEQIEEGISAFQDVYTVLQHPRCLNCHPSGDAPLQTDASTPHAMNVTRASTEAGMQCAACHQLQNSEAYGVLGGPPGAPNWHLPEKEMPLVFEGKTVAELCAQLKDPEQNGQNTLDQLYLHVAHDPLVLWGWEPGGDRSTPPLKHEKFARLFKTWIDADAPCPVDSVK